MTDKPKSTAGEDVAAALRAEIAKIIPGGTFVPPPPKESARLAGDSTVLNGQYRALETRVEDLRGSYHELRSDMDTRFTLLSTEISKSADNTNLRLDRVLERIENNKTSAASSNGGDITRYGTIIAVVATVAVSVIGGFVTLENNSINASIAGLASSVDKNFGRVEGQIADVRGSTVSRNELDYRINGNRDAIKNIAELQATHSQQTATLIAEGHAFHDDMERLKNDIVTRRENENRWTELSGRIDLLSTRLSDSIKANGGSNLGDEIKSLREQFQAFQTRFIISPTDVQPSGGK